MKETLQKLCEANENVVRKTSPNKVCNVQCLQTCANTPSREDKRREDKRREDKRREDKRREDKRRQDKRREDKRRQEKRKEKRKRSKGKTAASVFVR